MFTTAVEQLRAVTDKSRHGGWSEYVLAYNEALVSAYRVGGDLAAVVFSLREAIGFTVGDVASITGVSTDIVDACEGRGDVIITRGDFEDVATVLGGYAAGRPDGGASLNNAVQEMARLGGLHIDLSRTCPLPAGW